MRTLIAALIALTVAGCAQRPSQAQLEYAAYDRVLSEKVAQKKITPAEADLARQQYIGSLRSRESNIAANEGIAEQANQQASDRAIATGMLLMCAGQGHC